MMLRNTAVLLSLFTICLADITLPKFVYDEKREIGDIGALRVNGKVSFVGDMNIKNSLVIETGGMAKRSCGIEIDTTGATYDIAETEACFADDDCTYFKIEASNEEINSFLKSHIEIRRPWNVDSCEVSYQLENHEKQIVTIQTSRSEGVISVNSDAGSYKEEDLVEEGFLILKPKFKLNQVENADSMSIEIHLVNCGTLSNILFSGDYDDFDEHELASSGGKYGGVYQANVTGRNEKKNSLEELFLSKLTLVIEAGSLGPYFEDCAIYYSLELFNGYDSVYFQSSSMGPRLTSKEGNEDVNPVDTSKELPSTETKGSSPAVFAIGFIAVSSVLGAALYFVTQKKEKQPKKCEKLRQTVNPMNEQVNVEVEKEEEYTSTL